MRRRRLRPALGLAAITLLGLGLRLLLWRWRELQPLGGDEQEYLNVAVTLLRDRQYRELLFMRPPLYPLFLAAAIYAVDSLVQNLRLVQALVSAATIPLAYLLTLEVAWAAGRRGPASHRAALVAAGLWAASYTLAANAAELLSETLFLAGLTMALWLLLRAARLGALPLAALAGLALGALCLVRSVALPLLPLGAVWLALSAAGSTQPATAGAGRGAWIGPAVRRGCVFVVAFCIVVLPWTARNYLTYGGLILIDTTGAENLWLDNDPAGREAVKAQLFALGEDRLARQQLAARNGLAAIAADPGRFAAKAWGELLRFFALEHADDLRDRPAIWVRPADVWLRLALGDALWLAALLAGGYGLARGLAARAEPGGGALAALRSPAWVLAPWALYVLLTSLLFHVELRYRLPLFPALLPFAALALTGGLAAARPPARVAAALLPAACLALTLLHRPYPELAWRLGWKHWHLGAAETALGQGDPERGRRAALAALALDPGAALPHLALAEAALAAGDPGAARGHLDAAVAALERHPQARVRRGDLLRALGDPEAARGDLAFETASLQDLQAWLWGRAVSDAPQRLELGDGLDLGFVRGFHAVAPGEAGYRWSTGRAQLRLASPAPAGELALRVASGRPAGQPPVPLEVLVDGTPVATLTVGDQWDELRLPLPEEAVGEVVVELRAPTFTPRQFDRASPDGRRLGVRLDWAALQP